MACSPWWPWWRPNYTRIMWPCTFYHSTCFWISLGSKNVFIYKYNSHYKDVPDKRNNENEGIETLWPATGVVLGGHLYHYYTQDYTSIKRSRVLVCPSLEVGRKQWYIPCPFWAFRVMSWKQQLVHTGVLGATPDANPWSFHRRPSI